MCGMVMWGQPPSAVHPERSRGGSERAQAAPTSRPNQEVLCTALEERRFSAQ
jgi:hypothetical protein